MVSWIAAPLVLKEGRALVPIWLGTVVTIVVTSMAGMPATALLAFIFGAAALGVFSIGHEYAHRTLTTFLAQPLNRSRLLMSKVVVLAPLLVLLSLVAAWVLLDADAAARIFDRAAQPRGFGALAERKLDEALVSRWQVTIVVLTPLLGLCVAPWMTMVCRSVTAGLVFTLSIPAALWIAGQFARAVSMNFDFVDLEVGSPFGYGPALTMMTVGMLTVIIVAAAHGQKLFVGLEALDTPRDLLPAPVKRLPRIGTTAARSERRAGHRPGALSLFVMKEVRLYGLTFALAALYVIGWSALWLAGAGAYLADDIFQGLAAMYGIFVALLIGAISVAEERVQGTADMQRLQPWPFWKQSLAKYTTVGAISLLLGLAVPTALEAMLPLIESSLQVGPDLGILRFYLPGPLSSAPATLLLATLFSCYVSTLCVGGLRALMAALPLSFSLVALNAYAFYAVNRLERTLEMKYGLPEFWWANLPTVTGTDHRTLFFYSRWTAAVAFVGLAAILLLLCLRNSKSGEGGISLAKKQLPWMAAYAVLSVGLVRGGEAVLRWWLFTH